MSSIGEMFLVGFQGARIPEWLREFAADHGLGGVILFDYSVQTRTYDNNIHSPQQLRDLCHEIHGLPSSPRVFVDQEGGKVRRLKESKGFAPLPSAQSFPSLPLEQKRAVLDRAYAEMKSLGIDVNMAPVVDLNENPANPDIGAVERSYSADPREVLIQVRLVAEAAARHGVGLMLKHYPGMGAARVNSHEELTDISDVLTERQTEVFRQALGSLAVPSVLLSHAIVRQWDEVPVSISAVAVAKAREFCPEGVLVTDDMQMMGLQKKMSTEEACARGLAAGVDLFCIGNNLMNEESLMRGIADRMAERVSAEPALAENARAAVERVRTAKKRWS